MATLTITRGLPGSGKTTIARQLLASAGPGQMARVNRDDLRDMLHGGRLGVGWQEEQVTAAQCAAVAALLRAGVDVIADDTNLDDVAVEAWGRLAAECGAVLQVIDLQHVGVDVCIARDAARAQRGERAVGAEVIHRMAETRGRVLDPGVLSRT